MEIKSREGKEERPGLGLKGCDRLVHYIPTTDGTNMVQDEELVIKLEL